MKKPKIASFSTDTGVSASDRITNDPTLLLKGTADKGAKITIYDKGKAIGTAKVDSKGNWKFTTKALADGVHKFTVKAALGTEKSAASAALTVTVDKAPPAAPVIASFGDDSGTTGDFITSDTTLTLSGTAEAGSTVEIFDGATSLGTAVADVNGAWTLVTAALAEGAHALTARATDRAGNVGTFSAATTVTIDTTPPAAPAISGVSDDTGSSGSDRVTQDDTLTLTGSATPGATVAVYDGETLLGTAVADGTGAWTFTTAALADGVHVFAARERDAAGNLSDASTTLAVTIDKTAPVAPSITSMSDDTGASAVDHITKDTVLQLGGSAEANATVAIYDGVTLLGTATANGSGAWTFLTGTLTEGAHSFTARATDAAGNTGNASTAFAVTVDTTAPAAPVIASFSEDSGVENDFITKDTTITLNGTSAAGASIEVFDGATSLGTATADGSGNWSFTTAALAEGGHSLTAKATDAAGNTSVASTTLSLTIDTTPPAAPVITTFGDNSGNPGDNITDDNTITLYGTSAAGATIVVFDGATNLGTATADGNGDWSFTTPSALADGVHSFTARATDAAGNESSASTAFPVIIETAAPSAPTITGFGTDTGSSSTDRITSDTTPTLSGSAVTGGTVEVFDGAVSLGTTAVAANGTWSLTVGPLAEGSHSFTAKVTSAAGTVSAASSVVAAVIDETANAPAISTVDGVSFDTTPEITGTGEAGATVFLYEGATVVGSGIIDGSGNWTVQIGSAFAYGLHLLTARITDHAGNVSSDSDGLLLFVDDGSNPSNTLTTGADTVDAAVGNLVLNGNAFTLNDTDSLDGGDGHDTLALTGPGLFDLTALANFANFEEVTLANTLGGHSELFLISAGEDLLEVSATGTDFTVVLGGGLVHVDFTAATDSSVRISNNQLNNIGTSFAAHATGSTFVLEDGEHNFVVNVGTLTGDWAVEMTGAGVLIANSDEIAHFTAVTGDATNFLRTLDDTFDLTGAVVSGGVVIDSANTDGTTFVVDSLDEALAIDASDSAGGIDRTGAADTLQVVGFTLNTAQEAVVYGNGIELIVYA